MRPDQGSLDLDGSAGPQWPSRLGRALGITALQVLAAAVVFGLFMIPAANATSEGPDDWAGFEYLVMGALAAPVAGAIMGMIAAARMRMPLYGLYALPALLCAAAYLSPFFSATRGIDLPALPIFIGGNLLIALATVRRPRRPRAPRIEIPF